MKTIRFIILFAILILCISAAENSDNSNTPVPEKWTLTIEKMPETVDEFIIMRNKMAKTPQGGALMFIVALNMYAIDKAEGKKALVVALDKRHLTKNKRSGMYKNYSIKNFYGFNQIKNKPYSARSYIKGSSPQNGYDIGGPPYTVELFTTTHSFYHYNKGRIRIMVPCSGADSPRPITVHADSRGNWKAYEFSSLCLGMRPPEEEESGEDDL